MFCRSKSSPGASGISKSDGNTDPANLDTSTVLKSEQESAPPPRDRMAILDQRVLLKGGNKYVMLLRCYCFPTLSVN